MIFWNISILSNKIYDNGNTTKSVGAVGKVGSIQNSITIKDNQLSLSVCIPKKSVTLSNNKKVNNSWNSVSGSYNVNCP